MVVQQPRSVVRSVVEPVDVLIIIAAAGEDDAVRAVGEGGLGEWEETPGPSGFGLAAWRRRYQARAYGGLHFLNGASDEAKMWDRPRTPDEIKSEARC